MHLWGGGGYCNRNTNICSETKQPRCSIAKTKCYHGCSRTASNHSDYCCTCMHDALFIGIFFFVHLANESGAGHDVGHENAQQVAQHRADVRTRRPVVHADNRRRNKRRRPCPLRSAGDIPKNIGAKEKFGQESVSSGREEGSGTHGVSLLHEALFVELLKYEVYCTPHMVK